MTNIIKLALILALATIARTVVSAAEDQPVRIKLRIHPQPLPRLAFERELRRPFDELRHGNAALAYYSVMVSSDHSERKKVIAEINQLWKSPNPKEHLDQIESKLEIYQRKFQDLRRASLYRDCIWQTHYEDGFDTLLPHLAPLKSLCRLLQHQARVDIMRGNFDGAIGRLQTSLAMGKHCGDQTLIDGLVYQAIARETLEVLENYVQAKDAPNLYFALSDYPRPLVAFGEALRFERAWVNDLNLPELRRLRADLKQGRTPRIPMQKIVRFAIHSLKTDPIKMQREASAAEREQAFLKARAYLIELEFHPDSIAQLTPLETIFVASLDRANYWYDQAFKARTPAQSEDFQAGFDDWLNEKIVGYQPFPFRNLFPALANVKRMKGITDRKFEAWRCIEALRAHAATNGGKLPGSLDEVRVVPVPINPMTKAPFGYELHGTTATLTAETPAKYGTRYNVIYELTMW